MDYGSYDSASEVAYSEDSGDTGDYGFDGGADEQPQARQVSERQFGSCHATTQAELGYFYKTTYSQAEYVVLSEDQLRERQQELTETTQAVLGLDAGSAAHVLRFCDW